LQEVSVRIDEALWKYGSLLALIPIFAVWYIGVVAAHTGGWLTLPAAFLVIPLLPEAIFVSRFRNDPPTWIAYLALVEFLGSYLWA
jgi:hypothetical protein